MALYVSPGFSRAADAHLRLALMFKARRHWAAAAAHFRRARLAPHQDATFTRLELSFHAAHLLEAKGLRKLARDAYERLLKEPQLSSSLKADVCRQLGNYCLVLVRMGCENAIGVMLAPPTCSLYSH